MVFERESYEKPCELKRFVNKSTLTNVKLSQHLFIFTPDFVEGL